MTTLRELTTLAERTLEDHIMPYAEMKAIRDTLEAMLDDYYKKHKVLDAALLQCFDELKYAALHVADEMPSLDKLRAALTEQMMEERGNVERYSGD